ncbi:MAG: BON domain-containing protein [Chloroflexi bacterium]|nr:BON domain-containing protein [Chloroflexota bacterium]
MNETPRSARTDRPAPVDAERDDALGNPADARRADAIDSTLGFEPDATQPGTLERQTLRAEGLGYRGPDRPRQEPAEIVDDGTDLTTEPHVLDATNAGPGTSDPADANVEPSLMDQQTLEDANLAPGPSSSWEDPVANGDEVYVPPTDPVISADAQGEAHILGGFSETATQDQTVRRSSDGTIGDEALADAVRLELQRDAATTDLHVDVDVHNGIITLRGEVDGPEDAESAEAVASRVPYVRYVREELTVRRM